MFQSAEAKSPVIGSRLTQKSPFAVSKLPSGTVVPVKVLLARSTSLYHSLWLVEPVPTIQPVTGERYASAPGSESLKSDPTLALAFVRYQVLAATVKFSLFYHKIVAAENEILAKSNTSVCRKAVDATKLHPKALLNVVLASEFVR